MGRTRLTMYAPLQSAAKGLHEMWRFVVVKNYRLIAIAIMLLAAIVGSGVALTQAQVVGDQRMYMPMALRSAAAPTPVPTAVPTPTPSAPANPIYNGVATYYDWADGSGACLFDPIPGDLMVGAMNGAQYNNAALCGAYVQITGPKGVITVRITDMCPANECNVGHIDLSREAFGKIADISAGRVPITWRVVSPALSGPVRYHFKDGSNPWWIAVQIRNHRNPIARVEYRTSGGAWMTLPRMEYNYFIQDKTMDAGPYTFRITDIYGNMLIDNNIPLNVGQEVPGAAQFPKGP